MHLTQSLIQAPHKVRMSPIYVIKKWEPGTHFHEQKHLAHLIHKDSKAVIKVVRYGLTIASFPDAQTVQRVEQQIAREWPQNQLFTKPR